MSSTVPQVITWLRKSTGSRSVSSGRLNHTMRLATRRSSRRQEAGAGGEVRDALRVDFPDGIGQSRADRAGDRRQIAIAEEGQGLERQDWIEALAMDGRRGGQRVR